MDLTPNKLTIKLMKPNKRKRIISERTDLRKYNSHLLKNKFNPQTNKICFKITIQNH